MNEKSLHYYVKQNCTRLNVLCYKLQAIGQRGFPDLMLVNLRGDILFIELKTPKKTGRLSELQQYHRDRLNERFIIVHVVENKADAKKLIETFAAQKRPEKSDIAAV